ncbi:hypothetical protein [Lewinella sp. W8]|uniref:hypothetical protein n=1 Tax=Lewinella sp. W8 TaxID=2528208 RepID=UPI00106795BA|nr:hypothetical protein [Lewinella sp. W8]MTB50219.1 hypothetical protein [Lewinella sp. W8]
MAKKLLSSDRLLSLTAILISILTLAVFVYQTNLIREHQYTMALPYLSLSNYYSGTISYQFRLTNQGIGPAFIDSCIVRYGEEEYPSLVDYLNDRLGENDSIIFFQADVYPGQVLQSERNVLMIQMLDKKMKTDLGLEEADIPENTPRGARTLYQLINNDSLDIRVYYSSVYGERWLLTHDNPVPQPLN